MVCKYILLYLGSDSVKSKQSNFPSGFIRSGCFLVNASICLSVLLPNLQVVLASVFMVCIWDCARGRREAMGKSLVWPLRWAGRQRARMDEWNRLSVSIHQNKGSA